MLAAGKILAGLVVLGVGVALATRDDKPGAPGAPGGGAPFPGGGGAPFPGGGAPVPGFPGGGIPAPGQTVPGGFNIPGLGTIPFPGGAAPSVPGMPSVPGTPPGQQPTAPIPEGNGVLVESADGVVQLKPELQPQVLQALAFMNAAPTSANVPGAPNAQAVRLTPAQIPGTGNAKAWAEQQADRGLYVLGNSQAVSTTMVPDVLASVMPPQHVIACQRGQGWSLLLTPPAGSGNDYTLPSQGGGPTTPANLPGGFPFPGGGSFPFPGGGMPPGFPGGGGGAPAPAPGSGGSHTIRNGDIASSMALWYTGDFRRWKELKNTNPSLQFEYLGQSQPVAYTNATWRPGTVLVLPAGWDGSKGPGPTNYGVPGGSSGNGGVV